ncbi:MAG: hypothetical protein ACRD1G_18610, partial [Acidimicrobiales bacterium]
MLTVVTAAGLGRLFTGFSYLGPLVIAAVASHALAWVLRLRRLSTAWSVSVSLVAVVLVSVWT